MEKGKGVKAVGKVLKRHRSRRGPKVRRGGIRRYRGKTLICMKSKIHLQNRRNRILRQRLVNLQTKWKSKKTMAQLWVRQISWMCFKRIWKCWRVRGDGLLIIWPKSKHSWPKPPEMCKMSPIISKWKTTQRVPTRWLKLQARIWDIRRQLGKSKRTIRIQFEF